MFSAAWIAGAALAGALAAGAGAWSVRGMAAEREVAQLREQMTAARAAALAESVRLRQAQEQEVERVRDDAQNLAAAARRDAAAAADLAGRLRQHITRLAAATAADPAPAGPGDAAAGPGLVFADVLGRADARLRALAEYADQARIAGLTCQRAYEAVRSAP